jgi:hypothetical protein
MREVHPAFDPITATWFVGNKEAPTIRALLKKLGGDVVAIGYKPIGAAVPLVVREPHDRSVLGKALNHAIRSAIDDSDGHVELARPSQAVKPQRAGVRIWTDLENAILESWAAGNQGPCIAKNLGIKTTRVGHVIESARYWGDPRAVVRIPNSIGVTR